MAEARRKSGPKFTRDQVLAIMRANQDILADRTDMQACRRLIDRLVEKVIIRPDDIEVVLKFNARPGLQPQKPGQKQP